MNKLKKLLFQTMPINKIFIISVFFTLITNTSISQTKFNQGFKVGFTEGYCYSSEKNSNLCYPPEPPFSPLTQVNENPNSYLDGYNRGFLYGQNHRRLESNNSSKSQKPQFSPYVSQSPLSNMTPTQIEDYYNKRAQQDQQLAESIGTFLEAVCTVDPEKKAKRKQMQQIQNMPKYDRQYRRAQRQTDRLIKKNKKRHERNLDRGTSF